jgi:hypothetical protein
VEEKTENCRLAIEAYREALKGFTTDQYPTQYADTQIHLGDEYLSLSMMEEVTENSRLAIEAFNGALKFFTPGCDKTQYYLLRYRIRILQAGNSSNNNGKEYIEYFDWGPWN